MNSLTEVIKKLEAERDWYKEALEDIESVTVDFGYFEASVMTMREHAQKALRHKPLTILKSVDSYSKTL